MTKILPFKAYRYTSKAGDLSDLVMSQSTNEHISPKNTNFGMDKLLLSNDPRGLFQKWKQEGIVVQDRGPSIYTFDQKYYHNDEPIQKKGFICKIDLSPDNISTIREHEHVIEEGIKYHFDLLKKAAVTLHPIMGMYVDEEFELEENINKSLTRPISSITNDTGGTDTFGAISDPHVMDKFIRLLSNKNIFLADGHHRFHASIRYSNLNQRRDGYNSTIIYVSNMEDKNLKVFPYHRLYKGIALFYEEGFIAYLKKYFTVEPILNVDILTQQLRSTSFKLGLITRSNKFLLTLRDDKKALLMRSIDTKKHFINFSIIKEKILTKALKLSSGKATLEVNYETNFEYCYKAVLNGDAQLAIISPEISTTELRIISENRIVLPEKTTFFFPKAVSGVVFDSMEEE